VPVITTRTNGAGELIESELQGTVVPSADDCNAMTSAAEKLFKQTDRKDIQKACRELALQHSWDETVSQYEKLYAAQLAKPIARPAYQSRRNALPRFDAECRLRRQPGHFFQDHETGGRQ
jgi:hypothetical protein